MFRPFHRPLAQTFILLALIALAVTSARAYDVAVRVTDTTVARDASSGWLTVFVSNPVDTVAAFVLTLQVNRPDLVRFDSVPDLSGSVISNFSQWHVSSPPGDWTGIKVVAFADVVPPVKPRVGGFAPSGAEQVLLRIPYHILPFADTLTDRVTGIHIVTMLDLTNFSRTNGTMIGVTGDPPVYDQSAISLADGKVTIATACNSRTFADIDVDRNGIPTTVADLVLLLRYIVSGDSAGLVNPYAADVNGDCRIDLGDYYKLDSFFTYGYQCDFVPCQLPCACDHVPVRKCCYLIRGNLNNDPDNTVDLADLTELISFLSGGPMVIQCQDAADVNGVGIVDLADLSYMVAYLAAGGQKPPACQ